MRIPRTPPSVRTLTQEIDSERYVEVLNAVQISPLVNGKYIHWEKLRFLDTPPTISAEEWWLGIKLARTVLARSLPELEPTNDRPFQYVLTDLAHEAFHKIDAQAAGRVSMPDAVANPSTRDRYLFNSLLEEAITSSQLEGAATTRREAQAMVRAGRAQRNRHEQMVLNNYRAMLFVREIKDTRLTPALVLEIHRIITMDTLDDSTAAGRLQTEADERVVVDDTEGQVLHRPPPASELPERLEKMCQFANGATEKEEFIHPVLRAVLLHFWLAYDHPFADGNGRTARALFYWSMQSAGYWLVEYLSISRILRTAPLRYATSFLEVETDDNDLTYFIMYQLETIKRAINEMNDYLVAKAKEIREMEDLVQGIDLNHRQLALLGHALRNAGFRYTYRSHATSHAVTRQTARADLLELTELGILDKRKSGREAVFIARDHLPDIIRDMSNT